MSNIRVTGKGNFEGVVFITSVEAEQLMEATHPNGGHKGVWVRMTTSKKGGDGYAWCMVGIKE